jgi:hypothetical protein
MKLFSFLLWLAWAAIGLRVLLFPYWALTVNQGMFLLLIAAPAVGILAGVNWLFLHTPWATH